MIDSYTLPQQDDLKKTRKDTYSYMTMQGTNTKPTHSGIIIYHEREGRIEKSVPRIVVRHDHEACRVMTNGDTEGWIFLSYPHTNNGFFFLLTTVFIYLF